MTSPSSAPARWMLAAVICTLALPASAQAAGSVRLTPAADSYVSSAHPQRNFGRVPHLVVERRPRARAFLRFDVRGLAGHGLRATLHLYPRRTSRAGVVVRAVGRYRWHEKRMTYRFRPRVGPAQVRSGPLRAHRWKVVDVTSLMRGRRIVQLALTTAGRKEIILPSREARRGRPRLVLTRTTAAPAAPPALPPVVSPTATSPCGVAPMPPTGGWQHVVWIVMENKAFDQIGAASAPYINSLVTRCALATNFFAESHPSLPNYIAMTSGSTQGISDDSGPSSHPLNVPSIFSQLGGDWKALEESMPSNCARSDSGLYAVRHNPAVYYTNIAAQCAAQDVPLADPVDVSARFTFITPNECSDMHSCPSTGDDKAAQIRTGDAWLAQWMPKVLDSPQYHAGNTAVFLTWDEDDYGGNNHIATLVISPSTPVGLKVGTRYDHYAMLRSTEEMLGLPATVGAAASAPSMRADFHL